MGDVVLMVTTLPAIGTAPPDQLLPAVQSLLAVPVHVCAETEAPVRAVNTNAGTVVRIK
ncbi:hypothetical protein GCM10007858_46590 [Bradyrhizobium liaoningense]|nr:hypothetical protein GCM10007858_46590 [Bradyrhizobium liaoningense]